MYFGCFPLKMVDFAASFSAEQKFFRSVYRESEMMILFTGVSTSNLKTGFLKFHLVHICSDVSFKLVESNGSKGHTVSTAGLLHTLRVVNQICRYYCEVWINCGARADVRRFVGPCCYK